MGRYYSGDIEGKFWPRVQNSDDADFFGQLGEPSRDLNYSFNRDDLAEIEEGLETCREKLSEWKALLDAFFNKHTLYNDEGIAGAIGIDVKAVPGVLEWYARLRLGEKIHQAVVETGECNFTAEL